MKPEIKIVKNTIALMMSITVETIPVVNVTIVPSENTSVPRNSRYKPKANSIDMIKKANEKIRLQISSSIMTRSSRLITFSLFMKNSL